MEGETMSAMKEQRFVNPVVMCLVAVLAAASVAQAQDEAPDKAPAEAPTAEVELAFGTGIDRETRLLTGEAKSFATAEFTEETGQIFCLSRVMDLDAPSFVTHVWYHEGTTMAKVDLNVGSADWRTWSSKRILPDWTGDWEVKVLDPNGMVLASARFTIE